MPSYVHEITFPNVLKTCSACTYEGTRRIFADCLPGRYEGKRRRFGEPSSFAFLDLRRQCSANIRRRFVVIAFVPARKAIAECSPSAFLAGTKANDEGSSDEHSAIAFLGYCLPTVRDPRCYPNPIPFFLSVLLPVMAHPG